MPEERPSGKVAGPDGVDVPRTRANVLALRLRSDDLCIGGAGRGSAMFDEEMRHINPPYFAE
ncbi:MAG TPA: hypothetical protein VGP13_03380 [Candidatus Paceibacterota bacterium]|jgi:hypothetical protein|nr:hypothetical protein [Candidatus Paceibacterota bacterium]